jgi:hypothetical protein
MSDPKTIWLSDVQFGWRSSTSEPANGQGSALMISPRLFQFVEHLVPKCRNTFSKSGA